MHMHTQTQGQFMAQDKPQLDVCLLLLGEEGYYHAKPQGKGYHAKGSRERSPRDLMRLLEEVAMSRALKNKQVSKSRDMACKCEDEK